MGILSAVIATVANVSCQRHKRLRLANVQRPAHPFPFTYVLLFISYSLALLLCFPLNRMERVVHELVEVGHNQIYSKTAS
jgi:hypothetical protein